MNHPSVYPHPLRIEDNDFAYRTMSERVPKILRTVQADNPDYPRPILHALDRLHDALVAGEPMPMLDASPVPPPDFLDWQTAYQAAERANVGPLTWQHGEWFFAETFLYRHLIQAVRWLETGRDPFLARKKTEFEGEHFWDQVEATLGVEGSLGDRLAELLLLELWSNRVDLSHSASDLAGETARDDELLVDDRAELLSNLNLDASGDRPLADQFIHIVTDNAGTELAIDLVLADLLITHAGAGVVLQLKSHPTFVSDATTADVWNTLHAMEHHGGKPADLAQRLYRAWASQQLILSAPPFWTSSHFLWSLPSPLKQAFRAARLVILKGDVNYRRAMGDTMWDDQIPVAAIVRDFPAPLAMLRSIKCDVLAGIPPARIQALDAAEPGWRTTGRYGLIQFAAPPRKSTRRP
jgi:hypothetical protein